MYRLLLQESLSFSRPSPAHGAPLAPDAPGSPTGQHSTTTQESDGAKQAVDSAGPALKPQIAARHLQAALRVARPSVSKADRALYQRLRDKLLSIRSNIAVSAAAAATEGAPE